MAFYVAAILEKISTTMLQLLTRDMVPTPQPPPPPPPTHTHTHTHFLKWGEVNFDYLPWRGRESENFKKGVGSMVQGQVFLKGEG